MAKLIHIQNKSTFDSKVDELSPDSIVFIKDTKQIWTHGLLYSCPLSLEEINTLLENKANISDLSNVLAEEVIDEPLLSEINTLTREEIKKDLFIDMWNQACGSYGTYNTETGYFELNGLTDITYEEAIDIYNYTAPSGNSGDATNKYRDINKKIRTNIPINTISVEYRNISGMFQSSNVEVVRFLEMKNNNESTSVINPNKADGIFLNCHNLREVLGGIYTIYADLRYWTNMFVGCENLRDVRMSFRSYSRKYDYNLSFKDSPLLSYNSLHHTVSNSQVDDTSKPITITVHPDVYAKLTGDTTNQAVAALTPEEATQWQQLVTDAAAKQITFVTV